MGEKSDLKLMYSLDGNNFERLGNAHGKCYKLFSIETCKS